MRAKMKKVPEREMDLGNLKKAMEEIPEEVQRQVREQMDALDEKYQTPIEKTMAYFEKLKSTAPTLRDAMYLDGVLAVLDGSLKHEKAYLRMIADDAISAFAGCTHEEVQERKDHYLDTWWGKESRTHE